ncbi:MAG: hypothetical protein ACW991_05750 [Candidatus Hodarchaeales archaeon]|jgi:hypothetical protein
MTDYSYRFWTPSQGLEEQQAEVFYLANNMEFKSAHADKIKKYFKRVKPNSKHVRYAFQGEKMVGYIHARVQEQVKEIVLSYPWTIPNTPTEVRNTLFDEMVQFFRNEDQFSDFQLRVNPFAEPEANVRFLESCGFVVQNTWKELLLPLIEVASADYDAKYTSRLGTKQDIPGLISLIKDDGSYAHFDSDEKIKNYILEEVLPTGHLILVYEDEILTAACAPKEEEMRIIMDFAVFKNVKDQAPFIPLFVELAKACVNSGYGKNKPILVYTDNMDTPVEEQTFLQKFTPVQTKILMYYHYLTV